MSTDFIYMFAVDRYSNQRFSSHLYSIRRLYIRIFRDSVLCEVQPDYRYNLHVFIHSCHYLWWYYTKRNFIIYSG